MNAVYLPEKEKLDCYLDQVESLPPAPSLMVKLISLVQEPDRDPGDLVQLMKHDPAVTAEVLHRCNSPVYGEEEPVTDLEEALFRLGFLEVYRIAVSLFGLQTIATVRAAQAMHVEALWRHSAITAIIGGTIARELGESEGIAFTAGLLHDVGKMVLATAEKSRYADLCREYGASGIPIHEAEKAAFGFSHSEIGALLLHRWGVPEQVFMPVLSHHDAFWIGPHERVAAIVYLANLVAHRSEPAVPGNLSELPDAFHALELLGLQTTDLPRLQQMALVEILRLGSLLTAAG